MWKPPPQKSVNPYAPRVLFYGPLAIDPPRGVLFVDPKGALTAMRRAPGSALVIDPFAVLAQGGRPKKS